MALIGFAMATLLAASAAQSTPPEADIAEPDSTYVVLGAGGTPVARVITSARQCPQLIADGTALKMQLRAGPSTEPQRSTASTPDLSKPSAFPVRVCERTLSRGTRQATIAGRKLPLPRRNIRRILVIGDTGCRLKAKDDAWQACNDPIAYPFARIAARAATWKPDAVIHVGDYLYRENPCPADHAGCSGSPWGYGWDAWNADFFAPARSLLESAPLIVARGNHENCARAGQGWWRLLDPRPLQDGHDCNLAVNDIKGDFSPAYAVPLGSAAQVVVMDLSHAGTSTIKSGDPRVKKYRNTWRELAGFAQRARFTFALDHYPVFGVAVKEGAGASGFDAGNPALQQVFADLDPAIMPRGVDALLAGHIHLWEQVDFAGRQPSQFVAGFSGTQEDAVPIPKALPAALSPAPGVQIRRFDAITDMFGYMTLERSGNTRWVADVYAVDGRHLRHCTLAKRRSYCRPLAASILDRPSVEGHPIH